MVDLCSIQSPLAALELQPSSLLDPFHAGAETRPSKSGKVDWKRDWCNAQIRQCDPSFKGLAAGNEAPSEDHAAAPYDCNHGVDGMCRWRGIDGAN